MALLFFLILLILVIVAFLMGKCDLLSPWFLLCLSFFATYLVVLLNYNKWEVAINGVFVLYVTTAIVAFGLGCFIVTKLSRRKKSISDNKIKRKKSFNIESITKVKYPINLFLLISILFSILYVLKLILDTGITSSFTSILRRIYDDGADGYSPGFIFNQMREVVVAIAYINTFRLIVSVYSKRDKLSFIKLAVPIFLFLFMALVSTERNLFLRYAFYFICVWVFVYRNTHKKKNLNLSIILRVLIIILLVAFVFFLYGKAKLYESDLLDSLSIYAGSGLYNFNLWIKDFNEPLLYGQSSFTTFLTACNAIFGLFGGEIDITVNQIDPFISYVTSDGYHYFTNIYSALRPYVEDFGYFGVIVLPLLIGMLYQLLFVNVGKNKCSFSCIIYCMLIYSVIYFPILEQLFRRLSLGYFYELFWIAVIYYYAFKSKSKKKRFVTHKVKQMGGAK